MGERRVYEGYVRRRLKYAGRRTYGVGANCSFSQYEGGGTFLFSRFLDGLDGKRVRLTLEVLPKLKVRRKVLDAAGKVIEKNIGGLKKMAEGEAGK